MSFLGLGLTTSVFVLTVGGCLCHFLEQTKLFRQKYLPPTPPSVCSYLRGCSLLFMVGSIITHDNQSSERTTGVVL